MNIKLQRHTALAIYLSFAAFISLIALNVSAQTEALQLNPGETRVIEIDFDINTIAVGDPEICDVTRVGPREVLINAKETGKTNILIWDAAKVKKEFDITVGRPKDAQTIADEVTEMVKDIEGVNVRVAGDRVLLEGLVFSRKDLKMIDRIIKGMSDVVNTVAVSPVLRNVEAEQIEKAIGRKGVQVHPTEDGFLLQGDVSSEQEMRLIEAIASGFTDNLVSALGIRNKVVKRAESNEIVGALVQVDINVIEVEHDAIADLSSGFTASAGIDLNAASNAKETAAGFLSINEPNLRRLQDSGKARSLMQQSLLALSSENATFFVGEEFPITVQAGGGGISTEYKKVGLTLDILPVAIKGDIVSLVIHMESSAVTGEARGGTPILSSVQLNTSTHLLSGDSMAIAGAIKQRVSQSFFGNANRQRKVVDPIDSEENTGWDELFSPQQDKPNRYLNQQNEVLVVVSPKIITLPQDAIQRLSPEIRKSFKEYEYEDMSVPEGTTQKGVKQN